jgi:hypothetical protein
MLEREALQSRVFPRLQIYCQERGAQFLAVDLRWGITEAAQVDHDTLRICLDEIRRSQELSPRPNFAVFIGNRYGWEPIPARIPVDHWTRLMENASPSDSKIIISAYYSKPDTNAIPPVYILKSREGNWSDNEARELTVQAALRRCTQSFEGADRLPYFASATHQEIALGAMETPDAKEHIHAYIRRINNLPISQDAKAFIDWDSKNNQIVPGASIRLKELERDLKEKLPEMYREYSADWIGGDSLSMISDDFIDDFCEIFYQDQVTLIDKELALLGKRESYQVRAELHNQFAMNRSANFVGRTSTLKAIDHYISLYKKKDVIPLILYGEGGTGKSAIMSKAYQHIQKEHLNAIVLGRFIGGVPGCEEVSQILKDLIEDICRYYQSPIPEPLQTAREINQAFDEVLNLSTKEAPLILFIDSIDQLTNTDNALLLEWLPKKLNQFTRLILSTREGITLTSAKLRVPNSLKLVPAMSLADGSKMLDAWLSSYQEARFNAGITPTIGRKLSPIQKRSVLEQFKNCSKPLWLKLVYEEVRQWHSWDPPRQFPSQIKSMVSELINSRLLNDEKHLPTFTHRALAYIAAGRFGLSEEELAKALGADDAVRREFSNTEKTDKKWPSDRAQLPPILWSRLYFDISPYLTTAKVDGAILFRYFHREFKEVIEEELLKEKVGEEIHSRLAHLFSKMGDQNLDLLFKQTDISGDQQSQSLRRIMEEPWQLIRAKKIEDFSNLISNFGFVMAKSAANRIEDLFQDYQRAIVEKLPFKNTLVNYWLFLKNRIQIFIKADQVWPAHRIFLQFSLEIDNSNQVHNDAMKWLTISKFNKALVKKVIIPKTKKDDGVFWTSYEYAHYRKKGTNGLLVLSKNILLSWDNFRILAWNTLDGGLISSYPRSEKDQLFKVDGSLLLLPRHGKHITLITFENGFFSEQKINLPSEHKWVRQSVNGSFQDWPNKDKKNSQILIRGIDAHYVLSVKENNELVQIRLPLMKEDRYRKRYDVGQHPVFIIHQGWFIHKTTDIKKKNSWESYTRIVFQNIGNIDDFWQTDPIPSTFFSSRFIAIENVILFKSNHWYQVDLTSRVVKIIDEQVNNFVTEKDKDFDQINLLACNSNYIVFTCSMNLSYHFQGVGESTKYSPPHWVIAYHPHRGMLCKRQLLMDSSSNVSAQFISDSTLRILESGTQLQSQSVLSTWNLDEDEFHDTDYEGLSNFEVLTLNGETSIVSRRSHYDMDSGSHSVPEPIISIDKDGDLYHLCTMNLVVDYEDEFIFSWINDRQIVVLDQENLVCLNIREGDREYSAEIDQNIGGLVTVSESWNDQQIFAITGTKAIQIINNQALPPSQVFIPHEYSPGAISELIGDELILWSADRGMSESGNGGGFIKFLYRDKEWVSLDPTAYDSYFGAFLAECKDYDGYLNIDVTPMDDYLLISYEDHISLFKNSGKIDYLALDTMQVKPEYKYLDFISHPFLKNGFWVIDGEIIFADDNNQEYFVDYQFYKLTVLPNHQFSEVKPIAIPQALAVAPLEGVVARKYRAFTKPLPNLLKIFYVGEPLKTLTCFDGSVNGYPKNYVEFRVNHQMIRWYGRQLVRFIPHRVSSQDQSSREFFEPYGGFPLLSMAVDEKFFFITESDGTASLIGLYSPDELINS